MKDTVQRGVNQKNILTASQNLFHLVTVLLFVTCFFFVNLLEKVKFLAYFKPSMLLCDVKMKVG